MSGFGEFRPGQCEWNGNCGGTMVVPVQPSTIWKAIPWYLCEEHLRREDVELVGTGVRAIHPFGGNNG